MHFIFKEKVLDTRLSKALACYEKITSTTAKAAAAVVLPAILEPRGFHIPCGNDDQALLPSPNKFVSITRIPSNKLSETSVNSGYSNGLRHRVASSPNRTVGFIPKLFQFV